MKKISFLIILLITVGYYSCERDDLCPDSTQTTAKLILEAFDLSNQEDNKNIFDLRILGVGKEDDDVLVVKLAGSTTEIVYDGSRDVDVVYLPLRTDADETQFKLRQDYAINDNGTPEDTSDDIIEGNEDIITISYDREELFVSRACGFRTVFKNVTVRIEDDGDTWVKLIQSVNDNQSVEDEANTHFNLFH